MTNPTTYPVEEKPLKGVTLPCDFHWEEIVSSTGPLPKVS